MNERRLFIRNLDRLTTEEDLESILSSCGDVGKIRVRNNRGIVDMLSVAQARRARRDLDGLVLWGRSMRVMSPGELQGNPLQRLIARIIG